MTKTPSSATSIPRIRVFVDFWNYTLSMKEQVSEFNTDWAKIGGVLADEAALLVTEGHAHDYQGVNVYCSYDKTTESGAKFKRWATTKLDTFAGVHVHLSERQKKKGWPACPKCHTEVRGCPSCGADMRGTEEKGIDTRIVTDMMSLAWANNYDIAVIVSADRDFVPVAEFLQSKGTKVIHGAFPPKGAMLMQKCWGSIDIPNNRERFAR